MESLVIDGLDELIDRIDSTAKDFPERKRAALEELGGMMEAEVRQQVTSQGINDAHEHVQSWQCYTVGSKGGYVAVRPVDKVVNEKYKTTSTQVTRYLERGHGLPKGYSLSGKGRQRAGASDQAGIGYVSGFYFYSSARLRLGMTLKRYAKQAGEKLLKQAAERIVGKEG